MKHTLSTSFRGTSLVLALVSLALSGCSGMNQAVFPPVISQSSVGPLQGRVLGGHAPIVDAHVFLLEGLWTGYAIKVKSLLSAGSTGTSGTYPVTEDTTTGSVTNGLYYVTSDLNGNFNVTGDYTCDVGYPVYLYASGGAPSATTSISITGISSTVNGSTYTYTFTASNLLYAGQNVQFSSSSLGGKYASLNLTTQTVLATPTSTSFQVSTSIAPLATGANTHTGSATAVGPINPAIVNMGMLGICPSSNTFASLIQFAYVNEVSTAAMAYAMAGFATDSLHLGEGGTNEIGFQTAAHNAANLYNIQAATQNSNTTTVNRSGTVPQAELNTLANILANCVDSGNTAATPASACTTLFNNAPNASGTVPIDTATAAINIVHNPAANLANLYKLASGAVPFIPQLSAAPKDFTLAITYGGIPSPGAIAIDANGAAFIPTNSSSGYVTKIPTTGSLVTSPTGGSGFDSIAIDTTGNVFVAAQTSNAVYAYTNALTAIGTPWTTPTMNAPTSVIVDSSGSVYVTDGGSNGDIIQKFTNAGVSSASITNTCMDAVSQISLDPAGYLWADSFTKSAGCRLSNPAGTSNFALSATLVKPENIAIDSAGDGWVALEGDNYLAKITSGGGGDLVGGPGVGGLASPSWIAIDGLDNAWFTNNGNSYALSEYSNAGAAISPSTGYQGGNLNAPSFLAIDASGDVWVPNYGDNSVTELIGAAAPAVTPLSALKPGVRP
jgi:streptogramin lyase